jgi:hypothetical protein
MGALDSSASPQVDWIRKGMRAAESHVRRLRRADTWAIIVGTAASGLAAFVAGATAVQKHPLVGLTWVTTCAVAAASCGRSTSRQRWGDEHRPTSPRECEQVAAEFPDYLV